MIPGWRQFQACGPNSETPQPRKYEAQRFVGSTREIFLKGMGVQTSIPFYSIYVDVRGEACQEYVIHLKDKEMF